MTARRPDPRLAELWPACRAPFGLALDLRHELRGTGEVKATARVHWLTVFQLPARNEPRPKDSFAPYQLIGEGAFLSLRAPADPPPTRTREAPERARQFALALFEPVLVAWAALAPAVTAEALSCRTVRDADMPVAGQMVCERLALRIEAAFFSQDPDDPLPWTRRASLTLRDVFDGDAIPLLDMAWDPESDDWTEETMFRPAAAWANAADRYGSQLQAVYDAVAGLGTTPD